MSCSNEKEKSKVKKTIGQSANITSTDSSEFEKVIHDYETGYNTGNRIDTSYVYNEKSIRITFDHRCLFDSTVKIPAKYVSYLGIREFTTHNFESRLRVKSNGNILIDTIINKALFENLLFDELKKYGVLLYPNFSVVNDKINIDYSISIPMTDVGVGGSLTYIFDGTLYANIN
jgi:hypothetical protein